MRPCRVAMFGQRRRRGARSVEGDERRRRRDRPRRRPACRRPARPSRSSRCARRRPGERRASARCRPPRRRRVRSTAAPGRERLAVDVDAQPHGATHSGTGSATRFSPTRRTTTAQPNGHAVALVGVGTLRRQRELDALTQRAVRRRHPLLPDRGAVGDAAARVVADAPPHVVGLRADQADLELALPRGDHRDAVAAAQLLALDLELEARGVARPRAAPHRAREEPEEGEHGDGADEERPRAAGRPEATRAAGRSRRRSPLPTTPATTKAGAAQPPSERPVERPARLRPGLAPGRQVGVALPRDRHRARMMPVGTSSREH